MWVPLKGRGEAYLGRWVITEQFFWLIEFLCHYSTKAMGAEVILRISVLSLSCYPMMLNLKSEKHFDVDAEA